MEEPAAPLPWRDALPAAAAQADAIGDWLHEILREIDQRKLAAARDALRCPWWLRELDNWEIPAEVTDRIRVFLEFATDALKPSEVPEAAVGALRRAIRLCAGDD